MPLSFGYLSQTEKISEIKPPLKEVNKVLVKVTFRPQGNNKNCSKKTMINVIYFCFAKEKCLKPALNLCNVPKNVKRFMNSLILYRL